MKLSEDLLLFVTVTNSFGYVSLHVIIITYTPIGYYNPSRTFQCGSILLEFIFWLNAEVLVNLSKRGAIMPVQNGRGNLEPIGRRRFLRQVGLAGIGGAIASACGPSKVLSQGIEPATLASPRTRLRSKVTNGRTAMYLYTLGGKIGNEYSQNQIATVAKKYDLLTWVYANSGIPQAAHRANPDVIVTQYFDLTWVGSYEQAPGQPWMPVPWDYVNSHESFFSHSSAQGSIANRIPNPIFGYGPNTHPTMKTNDPTGQPHEWLANPFDFDKSNPESMDHWVNYFANSAKSIIEKATMDGIMMDEVELPYGASPFGYSSQSWFAQLDQNLAFIRERLGPDKVLFANGIFGDAIPDLLNPNQGFPHGSTWPSNDINFLTWCDGLQVELFVTSYAGPQIWPQLFWEGVCQICMDIDAGGGITLAQAPILAEDPQVRMFVLTSFHLVKGTHSYLSHRGGPPLPWFPEWSISIGVPSETKADIQDYLVPTHGTGMISSSKGVVYARHFSNGLAIANPSGSPSSITLNHPGYKIIPVGGGWIEKNGLLPKGKIKHELVSNLELAPQSGALVQYRI